MYKNLLRFSIFFLILAILFAIYMLLFLNKKSNIIIVEPNQYVNILENVHNNIDPYLGKKIILSGYVYTQTDFDPNRFVIAQNVWMDNESYVAGFLCENHSKVNISPNENIKIQGTIQKCIYNNSEYPVIMVTKIY